MYLKWGVPHICFKDFKTIDQSNCSENKICAYICSLTNQYIHRVHEVYEYIHGDATLLFKVIPGCRIRRVAFTDLTNVYARLIRSYSMCIHWQLWEVLNLGFIFKFEENSSNKHKAMKRLRHKSPNLEHFKCNVNHSDSGQYGVVVSVCWLSSLCLVNMLKWPPRQHRRAEAVW